MIFYVLWIFGPYETSIRMRLIRELDKFQEDGVTESELLNQYDASDVLQNRLERLTASQYLTLKDGRYYLSRQFNAFFIIEYFSNIIKRFISRS